MLFVISAYVYPSCVLDEGAGCRFEAFGVTQSLLRMWRWHLVADSFVICMYKLAWRGRWYRYPLARISDSNIQGWLVSGSGNTLSSK